MVSVAKGGLDLGDMEAEAEKTERERDSGESRELLDRIKAVLGERVKEVRVSSRLTESPACLVADENDPSGNLARILKSVGQAMPEAAPILEVNTSHAMLQRMKGEDVDMAEWATLLFEQSLLVEGGQLEDPAGFVRRMNRLMLQGAAAA